MAFIIDTINGSGLYAQSAASASVATYDSNGNVITATYLTAHQPISADEWNDVYNTVNINSGAWTGSESSPTASVDSNGSIDIVSSNNTVYFDVNGTWFNDAVNSALPTSAVQWNSNYDTVNTNSGVWGGSALNISAGEGVKVTLVNNNLVFSTDETVLYSGTQTYSAILSESVKNFDKILIEYGPNNYYNIPAAIFLTDKFVDNNAAGGVHLEFVEHNGTNAYCFPKTTTFVWHNNFTNLDAVGGLQYRVSGNAIQNETTGNHLYIRKIVGINRKNSV